MAFKLALSKVTKLNEGLRSSLVHDCDLSSKSVRDNIRTDIRWIIARKAYYFLKYALHIHTHHQNQQDAPNTIGALGAGENAKSEAGLRLVCQLKRKFTAGSHGVDG